MSISNIFRHARRQDLSGLFRRSGRRMPSWEDGDPVAFVLRAMPCPIGCLLAALLLRSMPMVFDSFGPQPKGDFVNNSRLAT